MHRLLEQYLEKQGIKSLDDLTEEELSSFQEWSKKLEGKEKSMADIIVFCLGEIRRIENVWSSMDFTEKRSERLITMHVVYKSIVKMIRSPQEEKEALKSYLQGLINKV